MVREFVWMLQTIENGKQLKPCEPRGGAVSVTFTYKEGLISSFDIPRPLRFPGYKSNRNKTAFGKKLSFFRAPFPFASLLSPTFSAQEDFHIFTIFILITNDLKK